MTIFFNDARTKAVTKAAALYYGKMCLRALSVGPGFSDRILSINIGALGAALGWLMGFLYRPMIRLKRHGSELLLALLPRSHLALD
ncbi:hypothetical protein GCM10028818_22630 [Spirosoma horti]